MQITSKEINIDGPSGNIQALLDLPTKNLNADVIAVNCHPHSLHGGTMTNKVVHTLSRSIASLGIPSLRFNFRGVANSEGVYDEGIGEQADLAAVIDWMQAQYPQAKLIVTGFSFGAYVSAFAAHNIKPQLLISVAPPVKRFDFDSYDKPDCQWKVIMGDADELVDYQSVCDWLSLFNPQPELITLQGASHFFHGRLIELREHIESIVARFVGEAI